MPLNAKVCVYAAEERDRGEIKNERRLSRYSNSPRTLWSIKAKMADIDDCSPEKVRTLWSSVAWVL
jgi:hypothetical protein